MLEKTDEKVVTRKLALTKKNQMETLELKNTILEIKN